MTELPTLPSQSNVDRRKSKRNQRSKRKPRTVQGQRKSKRMTFVPTGLARPDHWDSEVFPELRQYFSAGNTQPRNEVNYDESMSYHYGGEPVSDDGDDSGKFDLGHQLLSR
ncbi:hypothetical protein FSHL1_000301 [Fusarium sambucinum]